MARKFIVQLFASLYHKNSSQSKENHDTSWNCNDSEYKNSNNVLKWILYLHKVFQMFIKA